MMIRSRRSEMESDLERDLRTYMEIDFEDSMIQVCGLWVRSQ
jgi:hypothetical protein